jgi:hypothetical protein
MNYWINSNSGDYIVEDGGQYRLHLLSRWMNNVFQPSEIIELTQAQFESIKGFIPIKEKKLNTFNPGKRYAPTLSDGTKGKSIRVEVPTVQDAREQRLGELGL